jgi:mitochondrial intermediate peptidase
MSHPEGLAKAAENSIFKATKLVEMVCQAESEEDIKKTVKRVDTISDILCSVLDPAEFIRNVHPDEAFVNVANQVCSALHTFLSQLNTHKGLYTALKKVEQSPGIKLSPHEKKVASLLLQDFEKSGVHMSLVDREKFIHLNDQIQSLGQDFATNSYPSRQSVAFNLSDTKFDGVPTKLLDALIQNQQAGKKLIIPTHSDVASILTRTCKNPKVLII